MATGTTRNKVALKPGFSQMHWMMKVSSEPDLAGRRGQPLRKISMSEVAEHHTEDDAWTVYRGRVYNITPYLSYHPGGEDMLMAGAGKDCTELFDKYHKWVNAESMIGKLVLGVVDAPPPPQRQAKSSVAKKAMNAAARAFRRSPSSTVDDGDPLREESTEGKQAEERPEGIDVADASLLAKENSRQLVQVHERYVALMKYEGKIHAVDATCYHMGGPLLMADIEDIPGQGPCLLCPWHHYHISIESGKRLHQAMNGDFKCSEKPKQRVHEAFERDGRVFVVLNTDETPVESDRYATMKPAPSQKAANVRSGDVFRGKQSQQAAVASSMSGGDGKAPWSLPAPLKVHRSPILLSNDWSAFPVLKSQPAGKNTVLLTFKCIPNSVRTSLGFRGRHVDVSVETQHGLVTRPYTPIVPPSARDQFCLLVKKYEEGELSPLLYDLKVGSTVYMRGPLGGMPSGWAKYDPSVTVVMLAAGTGITPMLQVLYGWLEQQQQAKEEPVASPAPISLVLANRDDDSIPMRSHLHALTQQMPQLSMHHFLSEVESAPDGMSQGRIDATVLESLVSGHSSLRVLYCGPPGFHTAMASNLTQFGVSPDDVHDFM